eukprot:15476715-Alexandrium_andersonii.AAC.1
MERTPRELREPILRPLLGSRSSSSERLQELCMFGRASCGLRRIAALTVRVPIVDCMFPPCT